MEDSEEFSEINDNTTTELNEQSTSSPTPTQHEYEKEGITNQLNEITNESDAINDESNTERRIDNIDESNTDRKDEDIEESNIEINDSDIDESNTEIKDVDSEYNTERKDEDIEESNTERKDEDIDGSLIERKKEYIEESNIETNDGDIDESNTERKEEDIEESNIEMNDEDIDGSITERDEEDIEESNTERKYEDVDESTSERKDIGVEESNTEMNDDGIDESNTERKDEDIEESNTIRKDDGVKESNTEINGDDIDESNTERKDEDIEESNTERKDEDIDETNTERMDGDFEKSQMKSQEITDKNETLETGRNSNGNLEELSTDDKDRNTADSEKGSKTNINEVEITDTKETEKDVVKLIETSENKENIEAVTTQTESEVVDITETKISRDDHGDIVTDNKRVTDSFKEQNRENQNDMRIENSSKKPPTKTQKQGEISNFFTVHIQMDDGTVKNQIITIVKYRGKKPFLGGYRHKISGVEYHNASCQTKPRPKQPPTVELFSRDTQTFQVRHQKINTNNTTSTQMTRPGIFVSNVMDNVIIPGKYETADEYKDRLLTNIIIIQKYYRRWLAKHIVENRRKERDERLTWEQHEKDMKLKEKEERIKREYERRMHPKTRADFDLLYNGLERWRQEQLIEINNGNTTEAEKKAAKLLLLDEETDLLAAIDRHKIDRNQQSKGEEVQRLLNKAAAPKTLKDVKGRKIQMDTPYTIRSRELLDILNSLNMQYLTPDERLDVLLTLKHTVKEHDCKLTRDIIDLVDREADLIMRSVKDSSLAGLRKRIVTLFLQYCKTPTFNPEISLLLRVPADPSVLVGDINYCKYCGRYLRSTEFSLSTKSSKLTICKSCALKENQSRKRQDYSHYRRILKDLQMSEQQIEDGSKIAFIFKQNDIKSLMESVWDNKSILSECEDLDELIFVRWNDKQHWSPWNTVLLTKDEAEAHHKVVNLSETYSNVIINRINQKHVIAKNMFDSLEKMIDKVNHNVIKTSVEV